MFWIALMAFGLASVFVKLGAYSASLSILVTVFKLALFVMAALVIVLIWKKCMKR